MSELHHSSSLRVEYSKIVLNMNLKVFVLITLFTLLGNNKTGEFYNFWNVRMDPNIGGTP